jgi:hypothetical protein
LQSSFEMELALLEWPMISQSVEWKRLARARLAGGRAALLFALLGIPRGTLQEEIVAERLTATGALFLIGSEDNARAAAIERVLRGEDACLVPETPAAGTFSEALAHLLEARAALLSAFARVEDCDRSGPIATWIEECIVHDRVSADRFAEWRAGQSRTDGQYPRELLLAAARAARKELLTEVALIPEGERPYLHVDTRTLGAALFELTDEEWAAKQRLGGLHIGPRRTWTGDWQRTWRQFHDIHHELLRLMESIPEELLPETPESAGPALHELCVSTIANDRRLAASLRTARETAPPSQ